MSMDSKVPEIRFKGFSGEWVDSVLKNFSDSFSYGLNASAVKFDGVNKYLRITDIDEKSRHFDYCQLTSPDADLSKSDNYLLKSGDILFARTGASVGKTYIYNEQDGKVYFAGFLIRASINHKASAQFIFQNTQTHEYARFVATTSQRSGQPGINAKEYGEYRLFSPTEPEQTKIGNYFQKLDILINQHQQKHDKFSSIKKAMLEKMFPKQGKTIPEICFKGFGGEWENLPFGACFVNVPNNTLSRADLNYEDGIAKNIHYGDVLIKFGEVLDATNELLPFITNNDIANKLKHTALRDGDIIIADAAEDSMVGKCTELFNIDEQLVLSGLHTIAVRPTLPFASKYLGYYLNSSSYHDQLLPLMQGTKVLSISKTALHNTNVTFPKCLEEQTAIGNYFQKLDSLIVQHQQQITKLNNIKQACLSKMFV
ncbi:TPA: restriction endonuclease subunit S [Serratia fonticola]|nr:restriction endonuclease subunit S [Serratia fonticola]